MKNYWWNPVLIFFYSCCAACNSNCQSLQRSGNLRVVIIRHAEKPLNGDNLTCQGLNRSLHLPAVIFSKFGIPKYTYTPSLGLGTATVHARMFETVIPLAVKYNLVINSQFSEINSAGVAADIIGKEGTVLLVWEHRAIPSIVRSLGVHNFTLTWGDNDYDSIWIINFPKGIATFSTDKEGLLPSSICPN
jgi:hypothetical protein